MKRLTITLPDDLARAVDDYVQSQEASLTTIVQVALRGYLEDRGFMRVGRRLEIRVAAKSSGRHDVSQEHDRYLAGTRK
jgi:metal-responsive CopG/Arc/MetJ family transcriptional regulator